MPALAAVPGKEDANKVGLEPFTLSSFYQMLHLMCAWLVDFQIDLIDLTICEEVVKGLVPSELATETKKTGEQSNHPILRASS